jgi:hypothetical protein
VGFHLPPYTLIKKVGAKGRNRTADTKIFSLLLYQLSYLGIEIWWSYGESNPNFRIASAMCYRYHYSPILDTVWFHVANECFFVAA